MDKTKSFFQNKKTCVSFIMSILVFYIHFRVFSVFDNASGLLSVVFEWLLALTRVAVPLFFVISGALFYRDYNLKATVRKWKSRFMSLCVPYLIWNTAWLILALLGNYTPLGALLGGVRATASLENILKGIFLYGYFEPFWFLFQLIVLTAACPAIYLLLKNKWIGLIGIFALFAGLCCGLKTNMILLPDVRMVVYYLIGSWIGLHCFDAFTARKSKVNAAISFGVYLLCSVFQGLRHLLPEWCITFQIPLIVTVISCGAFWNAFDWFEMKKCPQYMTHSFLIYALHPFVGAAFSKILYMLLPKGQGFLILTAVIAFAATILAICATGWLLEKYLPGIKRILTGR